MILEMGIGGAESASMGHRVLEFHLLHRLTPIRCPKLSRQTQKDTPLEFLSDSCAMTLRYVMDGC